MINDNRISAEQHRFLREVRDGKRTLELLRHEMQLNDKRFARWLRNRFFRARLMTVKVLADDGSGSTGAVAEGIRYAAANGARIINLSLETTFDDARVRAAVEAAAAANALVICSAGNSGLNIDSSKVFPVWLSPESSVTHAELTPTRMLFMKWTFEYGPDGHTAAVGVRELANVL